MFEAILNNIINTLVRNLPMATRSAISFGLFFVALISFNKSIRKKSELRPIKIGWFVIFALTLTMSVLYVTL